PDVKLRESVIAAGVVGILDDQGFARGERVVVEGFGEGIGTLELQAVGEMLIDGGPEGIAVGVSSAVDLAVATEIAQRADRIRRRTLRGKHGTCQRKRGKRPSRAVDTIGDEGLINVLRKLQVSSLHSHISHFNSQGGGYLALNCQVPILSVAVVEIWINRKGAQADARPRRKGIREPNAVRCRPKLERHGEKRV